MPLAKTQFHAKKRQSNRASGLFSLTCVFAKTQSTELRALAAGRRGEVMNLSVDAMSKTGSFLLSAHSVFSISYMDR